jgi:hypothetical protein
MWQKSRYTSNIPDVSSTDAFVLSSTNPVVV